MRSCSHCFSSLPVLARADARYCSNRCRVAAHRLARRELVLPFELTSRARWIRRTATKIPLQTDGRVASSTNPFTWTDYEDAASSTAGVGLGFVLNGDGVVCLDVDHCVTDGVPDVWVRGLLRDVAGTYVELSPSGTGLHIWGLASLDFGGRVVSYGPGSVEIYGSGRYLTVTGSALDSSRELKPIGKNVRKLLS